MTLLYADKAPEISSTQTEATDVPAQPMPGGRRLRSEPAVGRRGRTSRRPLSTTRGIVVWVLASISLLTLWFVFYAVVLTAIQQSNQQSVLYSSLREQLALQTAPLGDQIKPGTAVALISAPSIGITDVVVVEGTASGDLMSGPGHRRDTVLPGQRGVAVLYGRGSLFGGPFARINAAAVGDVISVTTGQGVFTYKVEGIRRAGDRFPQPVTGDAGRLTLATADGSGRLGALTPTGTVYLDAKLVGAGQPAPGGRTPGVPRAEQAMQGDGSALLPLAIAIPLLLGSLIFVVWSRQRWGGWQTWLIGMPLVLATLWAVSQAAVQLLPNLL